MYIISKFESFSNQPDIEDIKDIFQELVEKWDMVKDSNDSRDIRYKFLAERMSDVERKIYKTLYFTEDKDDIYFIIVIDLSGPNDFYRTLYEFNKDCQDLLKRFQSEFKCELLTGYANQYLQSKGISTSRFVFIFRN